MAENSLAFPSKGTQHVAYDGMTLRDWFAGQALIGLLGEGRWAEKILAEHAYRTADAMLAERERAK
jgi:hypothetical protein